MKELKDQLYKRFEELAKERYPITVKEFYHSTMNLMEMAYNLDRNEWQLCPKCNGTAEIYVNDLYKNQTNGRVGYIQCDLCNGAMVIVKPKSPTK